MASPSASQGAAPQNYAGALQAVLQHPNLTLEQKIDAFKKLRHENRISELTFQQILKALGHFHHTQQSQQQTQPPKPPPPEAQAQAQAPSPQQPAPQAQAQPQVKPPSQDSEMARSSGSAQATPTSTNGGGFKRKSPGDDPSGPVLSAEPRAYPTSTSVNPPRNDMQPWPNAQGQRPTLSGGLASGLVTGTPAVMGRGQEDMMILLSGDMRQGPKKTAAAEHQMRRTIQDLVSSIDPNVKVTSEVEDLLLEIADEFIDSVANFSCRLAKHRGGDTLETRDLQLHLERNHNIRIPGFASDETRLSINQSASAPANPGAGTAKKSGQGTHMTLRSSRLNAVSQAKRDNKLM